MKNHPIIPGLGGPGRSADFLDDLRRVRDGHREGDGARRAFSAGVVLAANALLDALAGAINFEALERERDPAG